MLRVAVGTVHGWSTDAMLMAISIPEQVFVLKPLNPVLTDSMKPILGSKASGAIWIGLLTATGILSILC